MRVVYVTWDGPDQRYLESLFLPIFEQLRREGVDLHVVQFGWGPREVFDRRRQSVERAGAGYTWHPVHRRPMAVGAAATILKGSLALAGHVVSPKADVLMVRSLMPAAMALLLRGSASRVPLLFDADGLPADERVEFGGWSATGAMYRLHRKVESAAVRRAAVVMTRTRAAQEILIERAGGLEGLAERFFVVTNGSDPSRYVPLPSEERASVRHAHGIGQQAPWIVYAGSLGGQYLPERMIAFFAEVLRRMPDARLTLLTAQVEAGRSLVGTLPEGAADVLSVEAEQVPRFLGAADLGLALRVPSFSQRAVAPTKLGEYLLSGLPVLASAGIGDVDRQLAGAPSAAHLLQAPDDEALRTAAEWFAGTVLPERDAARTAARALGLNHFSLARCASGYHRALLAATPRPGSRA